MKLNNTGPWFSADEYYNGNQSNIKKAYESSRSRCKALLVKHGLSKKATVSVSIFMEL